MVGGVARGGRPDGGVLDGAETATGSARHVMGGSSLPVGQAFRLDIGVIEEARFIEATVSPPGVLMQKSAPFLQIRQSNDGHGFAPFSVAKLIREAAHYQELISFTIGAKGPLRCSSVCPNHRYNRANSYSC